ncbi:hypothetical protein Tco_0510323, partial [Tanacetum coccineum]
VREKVEVCGTAHWTVPDPETADPDDIDKYYESVNLEQEAACLMLSRRRSVSLLLSLEDEKLPGHVGT